MNNKSVEAFKSCPLFQSLDRIELAKISAELEEISLEPHSVLFEQGDPGDAFYIIQSGTAEVYTNAQASSQQTILLEPGHVFGEMALLTGERRSSSVRAHTSLQLWCMPAERFFSLLTKNRKIALSIERTLSLRLNETLRLQSSALDVSCRLLETLGEKARLLIICLSLRQRWPASTIEVICTHDAEAAVELDKIISVYHLLSLDNGDIVVDISLANIFSHRITDTERLWLSNLITRLLNENMIGEAVRISFLAGRTDTATHLIMEHAATLVAQSSEEERQTWATRLVDIDAATLAEVRAKLALANAPESVDEEELSSTSADATRWWQKFSAAKPLATALSLALLISGWVAPIPENLTRPALAALMSIAATIPLLLANVLPNYIITIVLAAALIVPGVVKPDVALSGFSSTSWLLMAMLFALSGAIAKSGLMYRLALRMLQRLPGNLIVLSSSLLAMAVVIASAISSSSGRATLSAPSISDLADAMRLKARSPGTVLLGLVGLQTFVGMGSLFLTASSTNLLLHGMMPETFRASTSWLAWLVAASVPHILLFSMLLPTLFLIYRPKISNPVDHAKVGVQIGLLGDITRKEKLSIAALVLLGLGFATRPLHGIPDVWTAATVCVLFFVTKMLDDHSFQSGINWGVMVYSGVLMGLSHVLASLKVDTWLNKLAEASLHSTLASPYSFVLCIAVLAACLRFLVPSKTLSPMMALVAIPLSISMGIHPVVAVLTILMAVDHTFFPFLNDAYPTYYHAMGGNLFSDAQARPALQTEFFLRILALTASVPIWQWMGLIPST